MILMIFKHIELGQRNVFIMSGALDMEHERGYGVLVCFFLVRNRDFHLKEGIA